MVFCACFSCFDVYDLVALLLGLACIFLAFVDGKGQPVHLLASPKPSPNAFTEPIDRSMFDSLLQIVEFKQPHGPAAAKSPGELNQVSR